MGKCVRCGKRGFFLRISKEGLCLDCVKAVAEEKCIAEERRLAEEAAEKKCIEEELELKRRLEREAYLRRLEEEERQFDEMVANIKHISIGISPVLAPKILVKDQAPITYSTITKKTPRDKLGNFVVIDTETTGLRPVSCEIIDIAAVRFRNYVPVEKVSMLLSTKKPIPPEATEINHITDEMVAGQPCFQQIALALVDFIGNDNLVGHNLPFDLSFIIRYGADVTKTKRKYYDTLDIARKTIKKARKKYDKELDYYYTDPESDGIEDYKLTTLCGWYGILNPDAHRAESDAIATGLLLKELADDRR